MGRLWAEYLQEIKVTAFHLLRNWMMFLLFVAEEFVLLQKNDELDELLGTAKRRVRNRRFVRLAITFIMIQYSTGVSGMIVWLDVVLTCQFISDLIKSLSSYQQQRDSADSSDSLAPVYLWGKGLFISCIFYYQLNSIKLFNFAVHIAYYMLAEKYFDQLVTKCLLWLQREELEGLEAHYARGFAGVIEIVCNLCLMLQCLILRQPYVVLIALYTNVYGIGFDTMSDVTSLFEELLLMAQFTRATKQELATLNDVCAVCLAPMNSARKTPCRHFFHGPCLRSCLKTKPNCPLCSKKLVFAHS